MLEVGEELRGKGTAITLFVFTDSLEVGFPLCLFISICTNFVPVLSSLLATECSYTTCSVDIRHELLSCS